MDRPHSACADKSFCLTTTHKIPKWREDTCVFKSLLTIFSPFLYTGMRKNFLPTKFPHPYLRASWQIIRLVLVLWVFLAGMVFLWFGFADAISASDCSFFSRVAFTKEAIAYQNKKSAWKDEACARRIRSLAFEWSHGGRMEVRKNF